jgi:ABC-type dipeptide/oligopeptide/nickel transport system permease subunit
MIAGREMPTEWYPHRDPGIAILVTVLALNLVGGLNDALSPTARPIGNADD